MTRAPGPDARRPRGTSGRFQASFVRALLDPDAPPAVEAAELAVQPGFAVYRNTVMVGCVDALEANYPAVARLLGPDRFRCAASVYVRGNLPRSPVLIEYGAGFADFLERFEPAAGLDWLAPVARLDRLWTQAHVAVDEAPLDAVDLARLAPEALGATRLNPHAAAGWHRCDPPLAWKLWRSGRDVPEAIDAQARVPITQCAALLVRPGLEVRAMAITLAECGFLDACAAGHPLADAAQAALAIDPGTDLAGTLARLVRAGAFGARIPHPSPRQEASR